MYRSRSAFARVALVALALHSAPVAAQSPLPVDAYRRADRLLNQNADRLVLRDKIAPRWIAKGERFWYRVRTARGSEFVYVDPTRRVRRPAFDHTRLAASLAKVADTAVTGDSLPFETLEWLEEGKATGIRVWVRGKAWRCDLASYACDSTVAPRPDPNELLSPDGKWALSVKDDDLWLRDVATGARRALTTDGTERVAYATNSEQNTAWITVKRLGMPAPPHALWSPDSRRVLFQRIDERAVPLAHLVQSVHVGGVRPRLWSFAFPFPGDSLPMATWLIADVTTGRVVTADAPPSLVFLGAPLMHKEGWWGDSVGSVAYVVRRERGLKEWSLQAIDPSTGAVRTIATERGATYVESQPTIGIEPNVRVVSGGREVIWYSERDGWGQLYLLDAATGGVKHRITTGEGVVRSIVRVDETSRRLWFVANGRERGRDPYLRHLYSVGFDGSGLTLLTPEDADHDVTPSPGGNWVIDRYSRADLAPVTVARSLDGKVVLPLEQADVSRLLATGWRWPERFVAKAADGVTDVYGVIFKPSDFDSTRRYPVIEEIYPGPQSPKVVKSFEAGNDHRALVELGMIGVQVDGRGTPYRSKAFHDYAFGRLETAGGLEDHVAAYKQIAATRPWMDLDRVGIFGHSGGGFASARAMFLFPDFYKVAVSSAGNHDQRGYIAAWGETYQGLPSGDNYRAQANPTIAANLQGKLMLAYGDMDDNVAPALTLQLIDALTKANKDYDLLVIPNGSHLFAANSYFRRRRWDYFVQHLLGRTPPRDFRITEPPMFPLGYLGTQP